MNLYALATQYEKAFLTLADSEFDEETIADTLEGMEGELVEKAQNVMAYALNLEAEAEALKAIKMRVAARQSAAERKAKWMRDYLSRNMAAAGITEIASIDGLFTIKLQIGRDEVLVIDEPGQIPQSLYRHIPESWEPDKVAIKKAIKAGEQIDGAHIEKKNRLVIA